MARIRTVKPSIWTDGKTMRLNDSALLLFIALFNQADDEGRLKNDAVEIEANCPRFMSKSEQLLQELAKAELIKIYGNTNQYIQILNFTKHQKIDKPRDSIIPLPSKNQSATSRRPVGERSTHG